MAVPQKTLWMTVLLIVLLERVFSDGPSACHLAGALGIVGNDWEGMASLGFGGGVITECNPCRNCTSGSIRLIHGWYSELSKDQERQCHRVERNIDWSAKNTMILTVNRTFYCRPKTLC